MVDLWAMSARMLYAKFRSAPLLINKAFRELITTTTTRTTTVAFWDLPSGSKNTNHISLHCDSGKLQLSPSILTKMAMTLCLDLSTAIKEEMLSQIMQITSNL